MVNKIHQIPRCGGPRSPADFSGREKPAHQYPSNLRPNDQLRSPPVSGPMTPRLLPLPFRIKPGRLRVWGHPRKQGSKNSPGLSLLMTRSLSVTILTARQCLQGTFHQTSLSSRSSINQLKWSHWITPTPPMRLIYAMLLQLQRRTQKWREFADPQWNLPTLIPFLEFQLQVKVSLLSPNFLLPLRDSQGMLASPWGWTTQMPPLCPAIIAPKLGVSPLSRPVWCAAPPCVRSTCVPTWTPLSSGIIPWFPPWRIFPPGDVRSTRR